MATFGQAFNSTRMANLAEERHKFEKDQAAQHNARMAKEDAYVQQSRDRAEALREDEINAQIPRMATADQLAGPMPDGQDHQQVFKADGQAFGTQQEAEATASRENLPSVRMQRLGETYAKHGKTNDAERFYAFAKQAREEGVGELLSAIKSTTPDIEAIRGTKAGFVSREIPPEALAAYDGVGKWRVPKGSAVQTYLTKDSYGNEVLDHRVVRPDGSVIVDSVNVAEFALGAKPGAIAERQDQQAKTRYAIDKDNRDFALREKSVNSQMELRTAQAEVAEARARGARMGGGGGGGAGGTEGVLKPGIFWTPKDDDKLEDAFTRKDGMTGVSDFDANGFQFAKRLALQASQQNGGDTASARAQAFEIDRKLQAQAGGDQKKLNELRKTHLQGAIESAQRKQQGGDQNTQPVTQPDVQPVKQNPPAEGGVSPVSRIRAWMNASAPDPMASVPQAQALDAARTAKAQAYETLQKYGSRQRQDDPKGFAAAQAAFNQASAQADAAAREWERYASTLNMRQR